MMTEKRRHCDWIKTIMIYSDNMIAWKHTCNISSYPNDAISQWRSNLLAPSARRRRIIDPGRFLTGGTPSEIIEDRGVVLPDKRRGYRGVVPMKGSFPLAEFLIL